MKLSAILIAMLLFAHPGLAADDHHHHAHSNSQLKLNNGKKWPTDAALRDGMNQIKKLVEEQIDGIHKNTLSPEKYAALSDGISTATTNIFKNCKLNPDADAVLHVILAQILDGMKAMKTAEGKDARRNGALKVIAALGDYPKYFAHDGWVPLKH